MGVFTNNGKNEMLESSTIGLVALFFGDPESGGTELDELTVYERKAITLGVAVDGIITVNQAIVFDVPAGSTINYVAFYDSTGTTLLGKDDIVQESYAAAGTFTITQAVFRVLN